MTGDQSLRRFSWSRFAPYLITFVSLVVVVLLATEVRALRELRREVFVLKAYPRVGQMMPTVRAASLRGDSVTIGETSPGRAQLLVFFSTTCEFCLATLNDWKTISAELSRDSASRFDVIWVSGSSRDSTRAYAKRHGIEATIVKMPSAKWVPAFQVRSVPMTLVLDRWGRVAYMQPSVFKSQAALDSVMLAARHAAALDTVPMAVSATLPQPLPR